MRSPQRAIVWELLARNRWGFTALGAYLAFLAILRVVVPDAGSRIDLGRAETFAIVVVVPQTATFLYLLGVFTFGFAGDLAGRESIYPARLFTLPVSTTTLAAWPMLIGSLAVALVWLAARGLAIWPHDEPIPVLWPSLLLVVLLTWTQALMWMPYGLRGARVAMAIVCLTVVDAVVLLALHFHASEPAMALMLAPLIPAAFVVARYGVARARRGDTPDWGYTLSFGAATGSRRPFATAAAAQTWLEWRRGGTSLPLMVATVVPCELALLFVLGESPTLVMIVLAGALMTPPYLAAFAATTVRKSSPDALDAYGLTTFTSARPISTAAIVGAKLRATILSTAIAWLVVLLLVPLFLWLSGAGELIGDRFRRLSSGIGQARALTVVALVVALAVLSTWKQLVQALYLGLAGRERLVKVTVFLKLVFVLVLLFAIDWALEDEALAGDVFDAMPPILAALAALKLAVTLVVAVRLDRAGLVSDRALIASAASWCLAVLALYGVLAWFLSTPPLFPRYVLMLFAILVMPAARISAAPLALAWNRHR